MLDYAMQTEAGTEACERFVEMAGLKSFFAVFMGKVCSTVSLVRNNLLVAEAHCPYLLPRLNHMDEN